jgi:hypothetical protein
VPVHAERADLSPDGRTLATLAWDAARKTYTPTLWSATTGVRLWQNAELRFDVWLTFDAAGERLVLFGSDKRVTFLDARSGAVLHRTPPVAKPWQLFVRDDFALVYDEQGLRVVDLTTWQSRWRVPRVFARADDIWNPPYPRGLAVPKNGDFFFEFERSLVRRRSFRTGEPIGEPIDLWPSDDWAVDMATSNDGKTLVVGTVRGVLLRFRLRE